MIYRLAFRPEVEREAAEAADWYDASIQRQIIQGTVRRAVPRKFPYSLIYRVSKDEILIVACIHGRRDPKHWQERVQD